ncbi:MAG: 2-amino-4-hydroxy-6-hydroxymethyldihydropteridine diphosphokinase [Candidatus Omnitrophota bacterium]|jgi:2-amino-4-hydroxy-6-hydroxymethyldihydropteridine diphosphokinase
MEICYLGVGANMGNRRLQIKQAVKKVNLLQNTKVLKRSALIQTEPVGGPPGQPKFLNAALKIQTGLTPLKLLRALKTIEKELGRKKSVRNAPRTIDLDILLYGERVIREKKLLVPHPRMFVRDFVSGPLLKII